MNGEEQYEGGNKQNKQNGGRKIYIFLKSIQNTFLVGYKRKYIGGTFGDKAWGYLFIFIF